MITQCINKYKDPWQATVWRMPHQHGQYDRPPVLLPLHRASNPNAMTKFEYGVFLRDLPLKKGDLVASQFSQKPYHERGVYLITDIDEVHHFVEWGPANIGPLCLNLKSCMEGVGMFKGGARLYKKVENDDIPTKWKEWFLAHP